MGTVHDLHGYPEVTLDGAAEAFLDMYRHPEHGGTARTFGATLRALQDGIGAQAVIASLNPDSVAGWFTGMWAGAKPATWNRHRAVLHAAGEFWQRQGWLPPGTDLTAGIRARKKTADRSRALSRTQIERLLTRDGIGIRERTLWRMLCETAARSAEVLRLDVEDLDLANRRAKVTRKGGAVDVIVWQTGTARLLPRLLRGRKTGPVFLTDRRARIPLPPGDVDPASGKARLSYRRAAEIFEDATRGDQGGPWTLHQLRHSALTHDAENGASTPMLMAKSGHTSVASLARYARPSAEALQRWQERNDPAARR